MKEKSIKLAWDILILKLFFVYLKFSFHLVSCVLSGNPACQWTHFPVFNLCWANLQQRKVPWAFFKKSSFRTMYSSARAVLTKHHRLGRGAVYFWSWRLGVRAEVPAGWVLVRRLFLACRQLRLLCVLTWPLLWALAVLVSVLPLVRTWVPWPLWPHFTLITFLRALSPNTVILRVS